MPGVFDCQGCNQRFYTDKDAIPHSQAVHIGFDDMVDTWICEECKEREDAKNLNV